MSPAKILFFIFFVMIAVLFGFFANHSIRISVNPEKNILKSEKVNNLVRFENSSPINFYAQSAESHKKIKSEGKKDFGDPEPRLLEIFNKESDILSFFKKTVSRFRNFSDTAAHLEQVKEYFKKIFKAEDADFVFELYNRYLTCSENLSYVFKSRSYPDTQEEIIETIDFVSEFRKDYLGEELYNILYKDSAAQKKYMVKKKYILKNKNFYSWEKKRMLEDLNSLNGKNQFSLKSQSPYEKYMDELQLNSKDFSELSEKEVLARKKELKEKFFSGETLKRMKSFEDEAIEYKRKVALFEARKKEILDNAALSEDEKNEKIKYLKDRIFSVSDAERYSRIEAINKKREKLLKEYGFNHNNK